MTRFDGNQTDFPSGTTAVGVDIGGSGIKAAVVSLCDGRFLSPRVRIPTPQPATPAAVGEVVAELVSKVGGVESGNEVATAAGLGAGNAGLVGAVASVGVTYPGVVQRGVARTAAHVASQWLGVDVAGSFGTALGGPVAVLNDADAAALAEVRWGAARGQQGLVFLATLGTGIGTALIQNGTLIANTELGHLEIDGADAEVAAADSARDREGLSWSQWAARVERYLQVVENLLWPDLIVLGGGVSKKADKFLPSISVRTKVVPAQLRNRAGICGAALYAATNSAPV